MYGEAGSLIDRAWRSTVRSCRGAHRLFVESCSDSEVPRRMSGVKSEGELSDSATLLACVLPRALTFTKFWSLCVEGLMVQRLALQILTLAIWVQTA